MIVIIGNGIAGVTAARYLRKGGSDPICIISSESKYFFSRTALMYVYMGHMRFEHTQPYEPHFWEKNNIDLVHDHVTAVDTENRLVKLKNGGTIHYSKLIIATGSKPNKFGWKGQDAQRVSGLYSKQDLEYIERISSEISSAVIVGGGLIGVELAEMLLSRKIEVHFLVRESHFWGNVLPTADALLIMEHFKKHHGLHMHYEEELDEIITSDNVAIGVRTKSGKTIDCQYVGLTAGVSPNIDLLAASAIETNRGVLINEHFETNVPNVYAIGDCAEFRTSQHGRRSIEQVWYTGKIMGESLGKSLTGTPTPYNPGHWFNSAKFFDIEYQTYGRVSNELNEHEREFIYQHPSEEILLHFVYDATSRKFIGVNTFGIRLRHQLFNEWLLHEATIDEVLQQLKSANFDPEFYTNYEDAIITQFNAENDTSLKAEKRRWWQELIKA